MSMMRELILLILEVNGQGHNTVKHGYYEFQGTSRLSSL